MEQTRFCGCGHEEKTYSVEVIKGETYCRACWKVYQERAGFVDDGCVFPEAEVCPDREPAIIKITSDSAQREEALSKARCYRGHKNCNKNSVIDYLEIVTKAFGNEQATCPHKGCGRTLKMIKTKFYTTSICPVHGIIFKAVLNREK